MKIANKISSSFFVVTVILSVSSVVLIYAIAKGTLKKTIYSHLETTVQSRAHHIESFLEMEKSNIMQLSQSMTLENLLSLEKQTPGYSEKLDAAIKRLHATKETNESFYEVFVLDRDGKIVASSDTTKIGLDRATDDYFIGGKKGPHFKDAYHSATTGQHSLATSAPIKSHDTGEFLGVVVARISMLNVNKITLDRTGLGDTGELYIINKDGYMITPSRFMEEGAVFLKQKVDTENARHCLSLKGEGQHDSTGHVDIGTDYRGVNVLGTHHYLDEMGWGVLSEIDEKEAFAPLAKMKRSMVFIVLIFSVAAYLLGVFVSRFISNPIHKLHKGTEIIGQGDLDHKVATDAKDEIGQLSRAFDQMTEGLKKSTASIGKLNKEIADREKAQKETKRSAEEWKKTFDSITDIIFIHDENHVITRANKAFFDILKLKPEDVIGKKCYKLTHKSSRPWPNCPFLKTKEDRLPHTEEIDDPNIGIPLLVTDSPVFDDDGKLVGGVHLAKDITELKKAENKMKEAMKLKSNFTSMVSHELRTPLTAIREGVSIVLEGITGSINEEQKDLLETSKRNIDRLTRLINDVLDFQKLDSGKIQFQMQENNINDVIKEIHKAMQTVTKEKKLSFSLKLKEDLPMIKFDRDKIIQVLTNLVNNAIKFTEKGGITIKSLEEENAIHVTVKDTGLGIKREDMPKLFQSFQQLGERKTGGTGLGLAISKEIINHHKGKIWAESALGNGTAFHFVLPIREQRS